MNILYTCLSRSWGETEQYTVKVIKNLIAKGIEVELVCFPESRLHIECNNLSLMIHPLPVKVYFSFFQSLKLAGLIRRRRFQLIHSQNSRDLWIVSPALKMMKRKVPLILSKHLLSDVDKKDKAHTIIYKKISKAIAVSNNVKENLINTCPIKEDKIIVIPNCVDSMEFNNNNESRNLIRNEFNIKDDETLISVVIKSNNAESYRKTIKYMSEKFSENKNVKILFLGELFRGEEHFVDEVKEFCLKNNFNKVIFAGNKLKYENILSAVDLFIYNSTTESFSLRVVEAMAAGCVVLCNQQKGIEDIITNNKNGFVFNDMFGDELNIKINKLIDNQNYFIEFQNNSLTLVKEKFDLNIHTEQLLKLYNELILN